MASDLFRLRLRSGEQVSLVRYPKTNFLDLPRELRDQIYRYSLSTGRPITICKAPGDDDTDDSDADDGDTEYGNTDGSRADDIEVPLTLLEPTTLSTTLATGLFYTNRIVSCEARIAFYTYNTFQVSSGSPKKWSRLWTFLRGIGDQNRSCIRALIVRFPYCEHAFLDPDGSLFQIVHEGINGEMRTYYQVCPPEVRTPLDLTTVSRNFLPPMSNVELLEPAARACFRKLGSTGPRVKIVLEPLARELPGIGLLTDSEIKTLEREGKHEHTLPVESLYVPEALENWAREETAGRVSVVWETICSSQAFVDRKTQIEEIGWEILTVAAAEFGGKPGTAFEVRLRGKRNAD